VEPFYFGRPGRSLFGMYHAPLGTRRRDCAVILCYPMGREYLSAVRAYRLLADQLSGLGFHVLRFDYYATGDSEGDCAEVSIYGWLEDLLAAQEELRRRSMASGFCLVGLGLGATIAAIFAAGRGGIPALALWDPVVQGGPYLEYLRSCHQAVFREVPAGHARRIRQTPDDELLGFAMSRRLRAQIGSLDLLALDAALPEDVLLIQTANGDLDRNLREHLQRAPRRLECHCLPGERRKIGDVASGFRALMRGRTVSLIAGWAARVCP
jgi:uncharacterized protein